MDATATPLIGAIEAGGTKMVCAVGHTWEEIRDAERFVVPTTTPEETMPAIVEYFAAANATEPLAGIGIASFGPVNLREHAIAPTTPKLAWRGFSWRDALAPLGSIPIGFDTDTSAAALAESKWGAGVGFSPVVYVTIGTGIGGGVVVDGKEIQGLIHPEFGHMRIPVRADDTFAGTCPSHGTCFEGLACGPAVKQRWGRTDGPQFPADHPAWDFESEYIALACVNILTITSPEVIILGGGVMAVPGLLEKVQQKTLSLMNDYLDHPKLTTAGIGSFISAPGLGAASGAAGAFALGRRAAGLAL